MIKHPPPPIFPIAPTSESHIDLMDLPTPINIISYYQKDQGNDCPRSWSFYQLSQGPEISLDSPWISLLSENTSIPTCDRNTEVANALF